MAGYEVLKLLSRRFVSAVRVLWVLAAVVFAVYASAVLWVL